MRVASKQYRIGSPAVTCSAPGDFATGCPLGRLGIVRESQRCPGFCACLRPAPHDQEVSASGGCCPAAKGHLWLSLRLPHACNGHDGVAGVKQDRPLTIGRCVEHPCGVPPVRKPQAQARGIRPPLRLAPHRCESASDLRGSPAQGRQKSPLRGPADCRRGEDTPEAPPAFADPLASLVQGAISPFSQRQMRSNPLPSFPRCHRDALRWAVDPLRAAGSPAAALNQ